MRRRSRPPGRGPGRALLALAACGGIAGPVAHGDSPPSARSVTYSVRTMGTYANIVLVTADSAAGAPLAGRAGAELTRLYSLLSHWTATTAVARLNRVTASRP